MQKKKRSTYSKLEGMKKVFNFIRKITEKIDYFIKVYVKTMNVSRELNKNIKMCYIRNGVEL